VLDVGANAGGQAIVGNLIGSGGQGKTRINPLNDEHHLSLPKKSSLYGNLEANPKGLHGAGYEGLERLPVSRCPRWSSYRRAQREISSRPLLPNGDSGTRSAARSYERVRRNFKTREINTVMERKVAHNSMQRVTRTMMDRTDNNEEKWLITQCSEFHGHSGQQPQCHNPTWSNSIPPKRKHAPVRMYCSTQCTQAASVIKRAKELLSGLSDDQLLQVMRNART